MSLNNNLETTYFQSSTSQCSDDLEVMYRGLGYDFGISDLVHDGAIEIDFKATRLDSIRVVRSSYIPTSYVLEKEDTDQGFQVFHKGSGVSIINGTEIPLSTDHASFHSGHERLERHEDNPGETTFVMWDESDILRFVSNHLGREVSTPVEFEHCLDFNDSVIGRRLQHYLKYIERDLVPIAEELNMALVSKNIANTFFALMLTAQNSNYRDTLMNPQSPAIPAYVKRARDYMDENADQPMGMEDLTTLCGISGSALHAGFRRYLDISPMAYLKKLRLERVRREFQSAGPKDGVGKIARRWGFAHLGRFAHDYTKQFNETPLCTLRKH